MDRLPLDRLYDGCGAWTGSMELRQAKGREIQTFEIACLFFRDGHT
jgi:hypothetical protein